MCESIDRAKGMLLGLAVGDTLGGPVEGWSPWQIDQVFGRLKDVPQHLDLDALLRAADGAEPRQLRRYLRAWRPCGIHSGDTQQALLLAYSLVERGGLDAADVAARLARFSHPRDDTTPMGVFRNYGRGFAETLSDWAPGGDLRGRGRPSAGNGAAMRIGPLGFHFRLRPDELARRAVELSLLTHCEARALTAAATVAHAVAVLSRTAPPLDAGLFLYELIRFSRRAEDLIADEFADQIQSDRTVHHQFSQALGLLDGLWRVDLPVAIDRIGQFATDKTRHHVRRGNAGFCLCSVVASVLYVMRLPESFEEAVVAAVNGGGDADTIGAMTGQMAGALHGVAGIPARWLEALRCRDLVERVAVALANGSPGDQPLPDLYEAEKTLTLETHAYQQDLMARLDRDHAAMDEGAGDSC